MRSVLLAFGVAAYSAKSAVAVNTTADVQEGSAIDTDTDDRDAAARTIEFPWCVPPSIAPYPTAPHPARVGDTVRFAWAQSQGTHHVALHPSHSCDAAGGEFLGADVGTTYTFAAADAGDVTFACDVGAHCQEGQIVTFRVVAEDGGPVAYPPLEDNPCYLGFITPDGDALDEHDHGDHDHGDGQEASAPDSTASDAAPPALWALYLTTAPLALYAALF